MSLSFKQMSKISYKELIEKHDEEAQLTQPCLNDYRRELDYRTMTWYRGAIWTATVIITFVLC